MKKVNSILRWSFKPFQGLWLFSECKFVPLERERYFRSNHQGCSKNRSSKSLKRTVKELIFLSWRLGIYSFKKKNEVIHRCTWKILDLQSTGSFTVTFKLELLLSIFRGTKITVEGINYKFWEDDAFEAFGKINYAFSLSTHHKARKTQLWVCRFII